MPIEKLLLRMPTQIHFTDALGRAIGAYNFLSGRTWNFDLLLDILKFTTINHLEFLTGLVQLLLGEFNDSL